jgi:hypothetical protein
MTYAFVVTSADPKRVGLTFKVEFDTDEQLDGWLAGDIISAAAHQDFMQEAMVGMGQKHAKEPHTTSVTAVWADGHIETKSYNLTMSQVVDLLQHADYDIESGRSGLPGRPQKRVLVLTTSKDRRTGALVARQSAY